MDEAIVTSMEPEFPTPTEEEIAKWEEEREAAREAELAPYRAAARQRRESAEIIAEHDDLLADMLFELTMNEFGEEV